MAIKAKVEKVEKVVQLKPFELTEVDIYLWGVSQLIMHKWSDKAKKEMLDKQLKKASVGKQVRDPEQEVEDATYFDEYGFTCFPSIAFRMAAVRAGKVMNMVMADIKQAIRVNGEMVPIYASPRIPREDMVRIGNGVADLRFRPGFEIWGTILPITINTRALSLEQLTQLFQGAGFGVGVGEWRPEKNGQHGCFEVAKTEQVAQLNEWAKERTEAIAKMQRKSA